MGTSAPMHANFDISIAGEINLDLILYGLPREMPCERELLANGFRMTLGSSSAILAHNLASLGATVRFASLAGTDELGAIAVQRLREAGVDLSAMRFTQDDSTGVTMLLPHGKERHILTYPGTMARMSLADLDVAALAQARRFHLSSLFLQTALRPDVPELFRLLRARGLVLSLDTNDDPDGEWRGLLDEILPLVDVFLPNEEEACRMTGTKDAESAIAVLGKIVPLVAVKCGARGALVRQAGRTDHVDPLQVVPVDTIGAGDSFNTGFLYALARGADAVQAARCGNVCGALSTLRPGGTEAFREKDFRGEFLARHLPEWFAPPEQPGA